MKNIFLFIAILLLVVQKLHAQVSGVKTIPGDYASITEAVQQIRTVGISGPTFLELQSGYNSAGETFPIKIREMPGSTVHTLTISPAAGATGISISSTSPGAVIELIGAYNIIIDGRPGRTGSARELTIRNNDIIVGKSISFLDGAVNNSVTYCKLESAGNSPQPFESGVVFFGRSTEPVPDDILLENVGNTVSNCFVESIYTSGAAFGAAGTFAVQNAGNKIMGNEIVNFYSSVNIWPDGGTNWTINGNSIYHLNPDVDPSGNIILFQPGPGSANNTISGNFLGGQAIQAGGGPWKIVTTDYHGLSIRAIFIDAGSTIVENNVMQNFTITGGSGSVDFQGIQLRGGAAQIRGNLIGGSSATNGITIDGDHVKTFNGILSFVCSPVFIENNRMSNISVTGAAPTYFSGISFRAGSGTIVSGNQIDQVSTTSSAMINFVAINIFPTNSSQTAECTASPQPPVIDRNLINNITLSSEQDNASFAGIEITGGGSDALQLHHNEVYKVNVSSPEGAANFKGITVNERIAANTGNIIGSATEANSIMVTGKSAIANGIHLKNSPDVTISDDIIANISAIGTLTPASVNGILFEGGAIAKISGNQVHHLSASESKGIFIQPIGGSSVVTIEKNTIAGINNNTGTGIETFVGSETSLNLIVTDNTVSNWETGVLLAAAGGATFQQSFQNNAVVANQTGFINQNGAPVNATCNWWGDASGPGGSGPGTGDPVGPNVIFTPWATIPTYVAVDAGADQTINTGSGPVTLTPAYTVCGTGSYLWSTGATTPSIAVSPTVTTVYSIKVTDDNGHESTDEVTVFVQNVNLPAITILNTAVIEGNSGTSSAIFILFLSKPSPVPVSVQYQTSNGTATAPQDYIQKNGTIVFPANSQPGFIQTLIIQVKGELLPEKDENFSVLLSNAINATMKTASATCTIVDNDPPCLRINDVIATENSQQAMLQVSLSSATSRTVKVKFDTKDGTAKAPGDYSKVSNGTLTFQPGETTKNITIAIKQDALNNEPTEKFQVLLKQPENATITSTSYCSARKDATVSILNSVPQQNREILTKTPLTEKEETLNITVPGILPKHGRLTIPGLNVMDNDLVIFDSKGIAIAKWQQYKNTWSPGNITAGIYFYQLRVKTKEGKYEVYRGKIFITD